ncbi:MAG: anhydro-N-acetylmuramic acid kinase [Bacteroidales bacterium]|nr:anhydro-N-acetylmuramic acid kinase [Bacteroidales bacterium]
MKTTIAIGLMSGSSLDGMDIALVRFQEENDKYRFHILEAETFPYPDHWKTQLAEAFHRNLKIWCNWIKIMVAILANKCWLLPRNTTPSPIL